MKCSSCGYELIKLNNWKAVYTGDVQRTYFKTFTLFAARVRDSFMKGVGFKEVTPSFLVCRQCGKMELYLDKQSLQTVLSIEADEDYSKPSTHTNDEQSINLTRMSKLRRSQNMNTVAQNEDTVNLTRMSHMRRKSQMY
jgi:hypothetical protein